MSVIPWVDWLNAMITQEIFVVDATRTAKIQKQVEERVKAQKCLCCDKKPVRLGLCDHHYYRYRTEHEKLGPRAAAKYEAKLRQAGKLLKANEVIAIKRRVIDEDAFQEAALEARS